MKLSIKIDITCEDCGQELTSGLIGDVNKSNPSVDLKMRCPNCLRIYSVWVEGDLEVGIDIKDRHPQFPNQLSISELIAELKKHPQDLILRIWENGQLHNPDEIISYRGWGGHLAMTKGDLPVSVGGFIKTLEESIDVTFMRYKGRDFRSHAQSLMWVAEYGEDMGTSVVIGVQKAPDIPYPMMMPYIVIMTQQNL